MKYFVRTDTRVGDLGVDNQTREDHFVYLQNLAKSHFLLAGIFKDIPGGMIIFKSENFDEADKLCKNDPVILSGYYKYNLVEWEVLIETKFTVNQNQYDL